MQLTHVICDACGKEITDENKSIPDNDGDHFPVTVETRRGSALVSVSIYPLDGLTEIDLCKHCISDAIPRFNGSTHP